MDTTQRPKRTMSTDHKEALAQGRRSAAAIDAYLAEIGKPAKRGRKRTRESVVKGIAEAKADAAAAPAGTAKLRAVQKQMDLEAELERMDAPGADIGALEQDFLEHAGSYSTAHGISRAAWRQMGVAPDVLDRAGITK